MSVSCATPRAFTQLASRRQTQTLTQSPTSQPASLLILAILLLSLEHNLCACCSGGQSEENILSQWTPA